MWKTWMMKGPAAGGGFSPSDIAGLSLWCSASDIVGLNDGDPVSTWEDLTANNKDFTQTGTSRPFYKTNIVNGYPALLFDGSNDNMTSASLAGTYTIAVVAKYTPATFNEYDGLMYLMSSSWLRGSNGTDDWYTATGPVGRKYYMDGVETSSSVTAAWHVFMITATAAQSSALYLGWDELDTARCWDGYVAEVCAYDNLLAGDDFTNLNSYLMTKYGIT